MDELGNDFEIKEPETHFGGNSGEVFSHSQLVMFAARECIKAGCEEMKEGYIDIKRDKFGNMIKITYPDTRQRFIETIETLKMVTSRDFDDGVKKKIESIELDLEKKYKEFCEYEKKEWITAHPQQKLSWNKERKFYREGVLSQHFNYYTEYLMEKVIAYRKIFAEIDTFIGKVMDDYREEMVEA